jgi:low affinity Fe/Cu permease
VAVGPLYGFSEKWLLIINTATTIITFLMVFLIQHTQNRDATAVQLKLSELLLTMKGAENRIAAVEHLSDEELDLLREEYKRKSSDFAEKKASRRVPGTDPEKACPALDAGWTPVFGADHFQQIALLGSEKVITP